MSLNPKDWEPIDIIAIVICVGVITILAYSVITLVNNGAPLPGESSERLKVMIISMISILSMYVGAKLGMNKQDK